MFSKNDIYKYVFIYASQKKGSNSINIKSTAVLILSLTT